MNMQQRFVNISQEAARSASWHKAHAYALHRGLIPLEPENFISLEKAVDYHLREAEAQEECAERMLMLAARI